MASSASDSHSILQKLINNLSGDLRQLSTETKKKYPPIKEAAEACNMKLREYSTMKDNLSTVMRDASVDLLQPFVLGCDTKQVKIVQLCLTSIQKLLQHHIVNQASAATIVNVLSALCELQTEELKILQTVLLLVNTTSVVVHSTLATLFVITFRLCFSKDPTIVNTSTAAVRQLVTAVYDRVKEEDAQHASSGDQFNQEADLSKQQQLQHSVDTLRPYARDAYLLFQDLCYLINGEQPIWLVGLTEITRTLILELIETILTQYAPIFHRHNEFRYLLKERVSPLIIKLFSPGAKHSNPNSNLSSGSNSNTTYDNAYFPLIARLLRVVCILIRFYFTLLITECEIFLSLLIKLLEPDKPVWQRSLAIECIHKIIIQQNLIKLFCLSYDMQPHASKILRDLTNAISSYVQSYFNSIPISLNSSTTGGQANATNAASSDKKSSGTSTGSKSDNPNASNLANGAAGSSNTVLFAYRNSVVPQYVTYTQGQAKAVYVENWEKFDCPLIPDSYGIVVAYACMLELVRAVQSIIEGSGMRGDTIAGTQLRTSGQLRPLDSLTDAERHECVEVVNCTWSSVLVTFTLLYDVCYEDTTCELLLRGFQTYISLCGMLGMNVQRDAFVTCLCKMALPPQYNIHLLSKQQNSEQQQQQSLLQKLTARTSADGSGGGDFERQQVVIIGTPLPFLNSTPATNQTAVMLTSKNIHCMRTLLSVAHCYGGILGTSWHLILTTLQHLVWIIGFKPSTGGTLKHVGTIANTDAAPMANSSAVVTTAAMADLPILSSMLSRLFESSVYLDDVALHHLIDALIRLSIESMEVAIIVREPSLFAIAKILETGRANLNRISVWWKPISSHLLDVCQHTNPRMREWGTEALTSLVRNALEYKYEQSLFDNERLLHMIILSLHELSLIQHFDVRQKQLEATLSILTNNGPTLQTGWPIILNIIGSITREHNDSLIRQAQQCLQLVVTDFLSTIPICYLGILIKVVAKFGFQEQDLNIALSAIGLLWNMTDYLFRMKEQEHQLKNVNDYLDPNEIYDNLTAIEELWMILYRKLSELTIDQRPAIRKSASSTLFTMITSHGQLLSTGAWSILIWQVLFPLFEQVEQFFYTASKEREQQQQQQMSKSSTGGQEILMHHSRDTPEKQWAETYVMILAGVTRTVQVKKDFLAKLDDFPRVWNVLLTNIEKSALAKNPEIALAALKSFNDLVNVPTNSSSSLQSPKKPLSSHDQQLWQQAWQVWLNIGNGCSRCPPERVIIIDRYDSNIPSQNFLTFYIDIFPNLITHIWSCDFIQNEKHFEQFATIIERVLAVPIHSDMALFLIPTDVNLTLLQESAYKAMEFVYRNLKVELTKSSNASALLPIVFKRLLVLVLYAINPPVFDCTEQIKKISINKQQSNGKTSDSNVNFVPFSEKILRMTVNFYEDLADNPAVIENGTLQSIIQTLQIPLSMKYNCPSSSTWKLAIECFFRVLKVGLVVARKHRNAFESMWTELAKTFDDFLFSKSVPPTDIPIEEIQRDEAIDCQAIELIRDDILPYTNVLPEPFITKILNILNRGSIYSCATDNFIDIDSARRLREEFSKICFETLLKYSFINEPSSATDNVVITRLALSSMLNRCKEILQKYAHDERLHGKCPLPRSDNLEPVVGAVNYNLNSLTPFSPRTAEMISVLKALSTLIGALKRAPKDSVEIAIWHQLIALYPCLVECTTSPSQQICNAIKDTLHQYFSLLTPPPSMSDHDDDDEFDVAPNYEKMRGMGFICWREIPGTNDDHDDNTDDAEVKTKNKKKRKVDAVEAEQEIETPIKKVKAKKKKKSKKKKRSNETNATSALQITNENKEQKPQEVEATSPTDDIETAKKLWSDLHVPDNIVRSLVEQKFFDATPIQRSTLPAAIRDKQDIIGAAETGSGKTLAFAIPILTHMNQLLEDNEISYGQFIALILTPTRELAVQIKSHIQIASRYTKLKTAVLVGGMSTQKQERLLSQKPEIIVATPGRFWELLEENNSHITDMSNLRFLAIDETDRMIEKGHFEELEKILSLINNDDNNQSRQKFVFSATLMLQPTDDNEKKKQKKKGDNQDKLATLISAVGMSAKPKIIDLTKKFGTAEKLTEARVSCALEEKDLYLYYFLTLYPGRTLIFTNSIDCIKRLQSILTILKRNPLPLHAQMEQKQRLTNLEKFSKSPNGLLIATDVAARGLDIPNINHIIHYQVPRSTELYIHRSGRTARAEREGLSVMFICPEELFLYRKIIKTLNRDEDLQTFPVDNTYLTNLKRRVRLATEISKLHHQAAKVANETNWYHKAAKELDIELDDNIQDIEAAKRANTKDIQKKEMQLRQELDSLLKQSLKYTSALS
ncbi:unnamed protein product, partial [Adineta ricciae]